MAILETDRTNASIAEAFIIFSKYTKDQYAHIAAEHDNLYCGCNPDLVSQEDIDRLEVLGFHVYHDADCFVRYT